MSLTIQSPYNFNQKARSIAILTRFQTATNSTTWSSVRPENLGFAMAMIQALPSVFAGLARALPWLACFNSVSARFARAVAAHRLAALVPGWRMK